MRSCDLFISGARPTSTEGNCRFSVSGPGIHRITSDFGTLSIPKMLSGANAFEISDIQEDEIARRFQQTRMQQCYITWKTCHHINSPETP
jgi:hypothetical protein